jgi:hypothetical protein
MCILRYRDLTGAGMQGRLLASVVAGREALPRQASLRWQAGLRVVIFWSGGLLGFGGLSWSWIEVFARWHEDFDLPGSDTVGDGGESAKEQAGDVSESSGTASGNMAAGEETKDMGEGIVDALRGLEVFGALGEQVGEVLGVGGWRFGVAGAELGLRVLDDTSALAAGRSVILATFGSAGGFGVGFGVRVRCFHGRSFLGSNFISKKFN